MHGTMSTTENDACFKKSHKKHKIMKDYIHRVKVCFIGEEKSGKSSLVKSITTGNTQTAEKPSDSTKTYLIHPFKHQYNVELLDRELKETETEIAIELWDMTGKRVCQGIHPYFYSHGSLYVVVFNLVAHNAMDTTASIINTLQAKVPDCVVMLVASRADKLFNDQERRSKARAILDYVTQRQQHHVSYLEKEISKLSQLKADPKILERIEWLEYLIQRRPRLPNRVHVVSSLTGKGIEELRRAVLMKVLDSELFPHLTSHPSQTVLQITEDILALRDKGICILTMDDLRHLTLQRDGLNTKHTMEELLNLLEPTGVIQKLSHCNNLCKITKDCICIHPTVFAKSLCSLHVDDSRKTAEDSCGLLPVLLSACRHACHNVFYSYCWNDGILLKVNDVIICITKEETCLTLCCRVNSDDLDTRDAVEVMWTHLSPFILAAEDFFNLWPALYRKVSVAAFGEPLLTGIKPSSEHYFDLNQCWSALRLSTVLTFVDSGIEQSLDVDLLFPFDASESPSLKTWLQRMLSRHDDVTMLQMTPLQSRFDVHVTSSALLPSISQKIHKPEKKKLEIKWQLEDDKDMSLSEHGSKQETQLTQETSDTRDECTTMALPDSAISMQEQEEHMMNTASGFVATVMATAVADYIRAIFEDNHGYSQVVTAAQVAAARATADAVCAVRSGGPDAAARAVLNTAITVQSLIDSSKNTINESKTCDIL